MLWVVLSLGGDASAPEELHGTWTTTTPDYADRAFAITDSTITFYQGGEDSTFHRLVGVEREDARGGVLFTLEYEHGVNTLTFAFEYSPAGEIRFKNQRQMVWRRVS